MKNTFTFNIRNVELFGQYWTRKKQKASFFWCMVWANITGRYEEAVVPYFLKNKYAVVSFDQFGHGKSHGKRGHCPSYEALLESLESVIEKAKTLFPRGSSISLWS
ncbi:alpha/beta hydrolase [Lacinutrix neustonica]|uniref:Alpha/beta hydrolase n=1 Tax=Lacinutrix neustonica TaxID=2980107 RepID=A0A9E8SHH0_9FLAO|nr:alpha/beta hydrolase [Lacinutrix neustonica]WAC02675.1 alpha/beta hydrolase [Lacinutrix neustonica]